MDVRSIGPGVVLGVLAALALFPLAHDVGPALLLPSRSTGTGTTLALLGVAVAMLLIVLAGATSAALVPERPRDSGVMTGAVASLPGLAACVLPFASVMAAAPLFTLVDPAPEQVALYLTWPTLRVLTFCGLAGLAGPLLGGSLGALGAALIPRRADPAPGERLPDEHAVLLPLLLLGQLAVMGSAALAALDGVLGQLTDVAGAWAGLLSGSLLATTSLLAAWFVAVLVRQAVMASRAELPLELWVRVIGTGGLLLVWLVANLVIAGLRAPAFLPLGAGILGLGVGLVWSRSDRTRLVAQARRPIDLAARAALLAVVAPTLLQLFLAPGLAVSLFTLGSLGWLSGEAPRPDFAGTVHDVLLLHRQTAVVLLATVPVVYAGFATPAWVLRGLIFGRS